MYKWIGHIALVSFNSNMGDLTNFVLLINMFHLILIHLIAYWW